MTTQSTPDDSPAEPCPLCGSTSVDTVGADTRREYLGCRDCALIFVPSRYHLTADEEKNRYELHDNSPDNPEYAGYIESVADTVAGLIAGERASSVLDFGSGRHCLLSGGLRARSFECVSYDPLYGIGSDALRRRYDCVVLCEVFEHFRRPREELERIAGVLTDRGCVVLRTLPYDDRARFLSWWYKEDPTHITFISRSTIPAIGAALRRPAVQWAGDRTVRLGV